MLESITHSGDDAAAANDKIRISGAARDGDESQVPSLSLVPSEVETVHELENN
jgi:hypothetical protein